MTGRTDHEGRPGEDEFAPYYAGYVARVPAGGLVAVLAREAAGLRHLLGGLSEGQAEHAYAPEKWSIKEVVGHVTDAERVFAYRALRIGRGDATPLASFDQDAYVPAGAFGARTLEDLLEEQEAVRRATVRLFGGLPVDGWLRRGVASGFPVSVRALACMTIGHELHHRAILEERYLPGL